MMNPEPSSPFSKVSKSISAVREELAAKVSRLDRALLLSRGNSRTTSPLKGPDPQTLAQQHQDQITKWQQFASTVTSSHTSASTAAYQPRSLSFTAPSSARVSQVDTSFSRGPASTASPARSTQSPSREGSVSFGKELAKVPSPIRVTPASRSQAPLLGGSALNDSLPLDTSALTDVSPYTTMTALATPSDAPHPTRADLTRALADRDAALMAMEARYRKYKQRALLLGQEGKILAAKATEAEALSQALRSRLKRSEDERKSALHELESALLKVEPLARQVDSLRSTAKAADARAQVAQEEVARLTLQVASLERDREALSQAVEGSEASRRDLEASCTSLSVDLRRALGQVKAGEARVREVEVERDQLREERASMMSALRDMQARGRDAAAFQNKVMELQQELSSVRSEKSSLQADLVRQSAILEDALTTAEYLDKEIDSLRRRVADSEDRSQQLSNMKRELDGMRTEMLSSRPVLDSFTALQDECDRLRTQLAHRDATSKASADLSIALEGTRARMQALETELAASRARITTLEADLAASATARQSAADECQRLRVELETARVTAAQSETVGELRVLDTVRTQLSGRIADAEHRAATAEGALAAMRTEAEALRTSLAETKEERAVAVSRVSAVEQERAAVQRALEESRSHALRLEGEVSRLQAEVASLSSSLSTARLDLDSTREQLHTAEAQCRALESAMSSSRDTEQEVSVFRVQRDQAVTRCEGLERSLAELRQRYTEMEVEKARLQTRVEGVTEELHFTKRRLEAVDQERVSLDRELSTHRTEASATLHDLEEQLRAATRRHDALHSTVTQHASEIAALRGRNSELQMTVERLEGECRSLEDKAHDAQSNASALRDEVQSWRRRYDAHAIELAASRERESAALQEAIQTKSALSIARAECESLTARMADLEAQGSNASAEVRALREEAATLRRERSGLLASSETALSRAEAVSTELLTAQEQKHRLEIETQQLRDRLQAESQTSTSLRARVTELELEVGEMGQVVLVGERRLQSAMAKVDALQATVQASERQSEQAAHERQTLTSRIEAADQRIAELETALNDARACGESEQGGLRASVTALEAQLAAAKEEVVTLDSELSASVARHEQSQADLSTALTRLQESEGERQVLAQFLAQVRSELDAANERAESAEGSLSDTLAALRNELAEVRSLLAASESQCESLGDRLQEALEANEVMRAQMQVLDERYSHASGERTALSERFNAASSRWEEEQRSLHAQIEALSTQVTHASATVDTTELDRARVETLAAQQSLAATTAALHDLQQRISMQEQELGHLRASDMSLRAALADALSACSDAERQRVEGERETRAKIDNLESQLAFASAELEAARATLISARSLERATSDHATSIATDLPTVHSDHETASISALEARLEAAEVARESLFEELDTMLRAHDELRDQVDALTMDNQLLKTRVQQLHADYKHKEDEATQLSKEHAELLTQQAALTSSVAALEATVEKLEAEVKVAQMEAAKGREERDALRAKLKQMQSHGPPGRAVSSRPTSRAVSPETSPSVSQNGDATTLDPIPLLARNVMLQYLKHADQERELLPVLGRLLAISPRDMEEIQEASKRRSRQAVESAATTAVASLFDSSMGLMTSLLSSAVGAAHTNTTTTVEPAPRSTHDSTSASTPGLQLPSTSLVRNSSAGSDTNPPVSPSPGKRLVIDSNVATAALM